MSTFSDYLQSYPTRTNFRAHIDCLDFTNKNSQRFVFLYEDIEECLKLLWKEGYWLDDEFKGDWTYEEVKYRKAFGQVFEQAAANSVASNLGSQTANTVTSLELYAGFLLEKKISGAGTPHLLSPSELAPLYSLKNAFIDWLKRENLSEKSIASYTGALASTLTKLIGRDLFSVITIKEFEEVKAHLEQVTEYVRLNAEGKQMYSSAINRYGKFLESFSQISTEYHLASLPENLHAYPLAQALITKPFTILTGASGTGKTKLAESLAKHYSNHADVSQASNIAIIPVGADWTDNRSVLGFVNHLRDAGQKGAKLPVYQSTPVLDLLLEANKDTNKDTPYFLILDEMNLSHVERYFSDFLSTMEQENGTLPLHSEGPRDNKQFTLPRFDGDTDGAPRSICYPENLYVIGTVNIDETTYMFSPKVLDRANVIEFRVEHQHLSDFLDAPSNYPETERAAEGAAQGFHRLGLQARHGDLDPLPEPVHKEVQKHLLSLFDIMQAGGFEFAYRTAKEVMRYMAVCRHLAGDKDAWDKNTDNKGWQSDLDDQVLQKILPKLHGSIGRAGPLLANLAGYCHLGKPAEGGKAKGLKEFLELKPDDSGFKKSYSKLRSMIQTLIDEQFVSFIQ